MAHSEVLIYWYRLKFFYLTVYLQDWSISWTRLKQPILNVGSPNCIGKPHYLIKNLCFSNKGIRNNIEPIVLQLTYCVLTWINLARNLLKFLWKKKNWRPQPLFKLSVSLEKVSEGNELIRKRKWWIRRRKMEFYPLFIIKVSENIIYPPWVRY